MTEPYVAEFVHPSTALKIPHPPPPLSSGLQHFREVSIGTSVKGQRETYVYVPHALVNVIGTRSISKFCGVTADNLVPFLLLEITHCPGEESSGDEIQEARRNDKEYLQLGCGPSPSLKSVCSRKS